MAGYLGSVPVPQATQHRETFTATAAQTTFNTAGYTPEFIDVYLNGVHLSPADVTATNGSDVVLAACLVNDIVDVVSYTPFEVASPVFTGSATFNEGSADADFRVESNGNANMLFVDGGNNAVGVGTSSPSSPLHVVGSSSGGFLGGGIRINDTNNSSDYFIGGATSGRIQIATAAGATLMLVDATGAVTMPLQPAFLVRPTSNQDNIAENDVIAFGTEVFDQNADFSSNTFTAPVAGRYQLNAAIRVANLDTATTWNRLEVITSNRSYNSAIMDPGVLASDPVYWHFQTSVLADMDAGDTAQLRWGQNAGATQVDIDVDSHFSGYLVA